jgi:uncharacterized protein with von Willebrand factor type A (vWA) domain
MGQDRTGFYKIKKDICVDFNKVKYIQRIEKENRYYIKIVFDKETFLELELESKEEYKNIVKSIENYF